MQKALPNEWNNYLASNSNYIGDAFIRGTLYLIDFYPGLVEGEGTVHGEVHELLSPERTIARLDEYEDFIPNNHSSSLYIRKTTVATLHSNRQQIEVETYYFNRAIENYPMISSGSFV